MMEKNITKSFQDVQWEVNINWISPASLWNSTTVIILIHIRASQKGLFLWNNFFRVGHNFFPLFRSKAMQKTKNWKFLCIFSPGPSPLKFYYIKHLCEMELPYFRYYKTVLYLFLRLFGHSSRPRTLFFLASLELLVRLLFKGVLYSRASYNSGNTVFIIWLNL